MGEQGSKGQKDAGRDIEAERCYGRELRREGGYAGSRRWNLIAEGVRAVNKVVNGPID
jgi:hypothetical protein